MYGNFCVYVCVCVCMCVFVCVCAPLLFRLLVVCQLCEKSSLLLHILECSECSRGGKTGLGPQTLTLKRIPSDSSESWPAVTSLHVVCRYSVKSLT